MRNLAKAGEMDNENKFKMGDPYHCPECDRMHTKGKIYKEHLKYIQNSVSEEDNIDETIKETDVNEDLDNELEEEFEDNEEN